MTEAVLLSVNGRGVRIEGDPARPLLDVLRADLGLTATRFGCGEGACGACTVLIDGKAMTACDTPLWAVAGKAVTTLEGLGNEAAPHPLQTAMIAEQAMQCGYCVSGVMMRAAALLAVTPDPDDAAIRAALDGHLCRCGAQNRMVRAIQHAAAAMRGARHG